MSGPLAGLYPRMGPWTSAALWFGLWDQPPPPTPIEPELPTITRQRLGPLLVRYLRANAPGALRSEASEAAGTAFRLTGHSQRILLSGAQISARLRQNGISNAVVKGPAIAAVYPALQDRPYLDLDVYVAPADFAAALGLCREWGLQESLASRLPREFMVRACREGVNLSDADGTSVDLHHHVPPWLWGQRLRTRDVVARAGPRIFAGQELYCASVEDNLLIASLHLVSDKNHPGATLIIWRDVVQLAQVVDGARFSSLARAAGLSGWVAAALAQVPAAVRPDALIAACEATADGIPHPHRLRRLVEAGTWPGVLESQMLRLPVARGLAFALGMTVPEREFLRRNVGDGPFPIVRWWNAGRHRRSQQLPWEPAS